MDGKPDSKNAETPAGNAGEAQTVVLPSGLVIVLKEDHSAPVVSVQGWCKAGSIHEGKWLGAGLSHLLEHMLFKGTRRRKAGQIEQEVQAAGGYINAYTSFDRTVYHVEAPNTGVAIALDILSDILQHATLPEDELAREMDVIRREMDMQHDDPAARAGRRLWEVAYTCSPYRFTVIGYPDIFNTLKRRDIVEYYRSQYAPNNLFFVIAGDFEAGAVEEQLRKAFEKSRARPLAPVYLPPEPPQVAPREVIEEDSVELVQYHCAWHIPDVRHADVPALDVLSTVLGYGRSSRLYQRVRESGWAASVEAWTYSGSHCGMMGLTALVEPGKFRGARDAMHAEIERVLSDGITEEEVRKAAKQFKAAFLSARKTMQGQARDLGGCFLTTGDLNFSRRYLAAAEKVTPADLQRVARQYLRPENSVTYALVPRGLKTGRRSSYSTTFAKPVHKWILPNGLRLLVKEDHRLPFIEYRAVMRGGVLVETPQTNGATLLAAHLLHKGTRSRSAEQIAREIESLGGSLDTYSANNSIGVTAEVMSGDFEAGLDLLADVLLNPVFPETAFEREREVQLAALKDQRDQLLESAFRMLRKGLFGTEGYGLDPLGTEESLRGLTPEILRKIYQQLAGPSNCVLAIYGDVQAENVRATVEKVFLNWKNKPEIPPLPKASELRKQVRLEETRDKKQGVICIGFPGTTIYESDRFAMELLQEVCNDMGSRLYMRIREKLGLAYYVGAQLLLGLAPGYFSFYAGTTPSKLGRCQREFIEEIRLLRQKGVDADELDRAKAKILGQKKISRQDLGHCALMAALDELYGLGYSFSDTEDARIEAVTAGDIRAAANKYLDVDKMVVAVIKPGSTCA